MAFFSAIDAHRSYDRFHSSSGRVRGERTALPVPDQICGALTSTPDCSSCSQHRHADPVLFTPVATSTLTLTIAPAIADLFGQSVQPHVGHRDYRPKVRPRKFSATCSRSRQMRETCLFEIPSQPRDLTRSSKLAGSTLAPRRHAGSPLPTPSHCSRHGSSPTLAEGSNSPL